MFVPAVLRWCASAAPERCEVVARGFADPGRSPAGGVIWRIEELVAELGLPGRLRDLGVPSGDLEAIASACVSDPNVRASPWQPSDARELAAKLWELW